MKSTTKKQTSKKFKKRVVFEEKKHKEKSPSISRNIPEKKNFLSLIFNKYFLVSFITVFLGVAVSLQGISVKKSLEKLQIIKGERSRLQNEVTYWESITKQHNSYRDAYFKIALLEYQLGDKEKAKYYLEKTLEIDPNYAPALDFRKEVGLTYSL